MNLSEIVANVKAELPTATGIDALIKRWAGKAQGKFLAEASLLGHEFSWLSQPNLTLSVVSGTQEYALSAFLDMAKIKYFTERTTKRRIEMKTIQEIRERMPDPTTWDGPPEFAYFAGYSPVQEQPTSASLIEAVSTLGDTSVIKFEGLNAAGTAMIGEELTLTGAVPVQTVNQYSQIINIGINGFFTGTLTLTSNAGVVTNAVISPRMRQPRFPKVGFLPVPSSAMTLYYDGNFDLPPLVNDNDFSLIPERYHDAIEEYCLYRGQRHKKDYESAMVHIAAFKDVVIQAVKDDKKPEQDLIMESRPLGSRLSEGALPWGFPRNY